jgi:hypothetical protein
MHIGAALAAIGLALAGPAGLPSDTTRTGVTGCTVRFAIHNHTTDTVTIDWAASDVRIGKHWPGGRPEGLVTGLDGGPATTSVPAGGDAKAMRDVRVPCSEIRQVSARIVDRGGDVWFEQTQRQNPGDRDTVPVLHITRWHRQVATQPPAAGACRLTTPTEAAPD